MIRPPMILEKVDTFLKKLENKVRGPIFYVIPWIQDIHDFTDQGVFGLETPHSGVNNIFHDYISKLRVAVEIRNLGSLEPKSITFPQALFMTDRYSGSTMYYHFFEKAQNEMKNPALITAALSSIAHMISETAGKRGDLLGIDNGNSYIDFQYGKNIIGILYSTKEDKTLSNLLLEFTGRFEEEFQEALVDFSNTGKIGGFAPATTLVNTVFEDWIFEIITVNSQLRENILNFRENSQQLRIDPEETFQNYVTENIADTDVHDLLFYEFTTSHNQRHEFLLNLGINPLYKKQSIEEEIGNSLCSCTEPPKYVQIQGFDALGLLDLPEKFRPTAQAFFTSKTLTPESASKITFRDQSTELEVLEELTRLGFVRKIIPNID
ncbi:MAG: hypothetical protein ACW98F_18750, partial [Candidatus Hodarchaeales archaeon]